MDSIVGVRLFKVMDELWIAELRRANRRSGSYVSFNFIFLPISMATNPGIGPGPHPPAAETATLA